MKLEPVDRRTGGSPSGHTRDFRAGLRAAERLYQDWLPDEIEDIPTLQFAAGAIERLGQLMRDAPEAEKASRRGADRGAESLTARPFQGILEQLQNADDLAASELRLAVLGDNLLLVHDGNRVRLAHVVAMLMPWLTTKADDPIASGRFGIGQRTLGILGGPIQVHCHPYHFTITADGPVPCPQHPAMEGFYDSVKPETLVVVPLFDTVNRVDLENYVKGLGIRTLLFLGSVRRILLINPHDNSHVVDYRFQRDDPQSTNVEVAGETLVAQRLTLMDPDSDLQFDRYLVKRPLHGDDRRHHKATGHFTTLGLALPSRHGPLGGFYDRLPLPFESRLPFSLTAQFDPDAARTTLLPKKWNEHRLRDLGDLVAAAALDRFSADPCDGWWAIPISKEVVPMAADEWVVGHVREVVVKASQAKIADTLQVPVDVGSRPISELTYEALPLDGLLTAEDQVYLSPGHAAVPSSSRDDEGRWRDVLVELGRSHPIPVADALALLDQSDDELGQREPAWYVRMAKAAVHEGLLTKFLWKRGILLADGRRVVPPGHKDPRSLVCRVSPHSLAAKLGLALPVHPEYLADKADAKIVINALKRANVLIDEVDSSEAVLDALARDGMQECVQLTDTQLTALRDAFEHLSEEQQRVLGPRIGRNVELRGRRYNNRGKSEKIWISPADAYLPSAIDHETDSFGLAADRTPGLAWLDTSYAWVLKRTGGRREAGDQRFLVRLGAATAPRLTNALDEVQPWRRDPRLVSPRFGQDRPPIQSLEINALEYSATHLMDDRWSPDLDAVIWHIRADRDADSRRRRGLALLGVFARTWDRMYAEHQYAKAVWANNGYWHESGRVISTWLARAASEPWLPNAKGTLRAPSELYLPTDANRLAYGNDKRLFLADVPDHVLRSPASLGLRMKSGPSASNLVDRLVQLRDGPEGEVDDTEVRKVYELLALKCPVPDARSRLVDDLTSSQLRTAFKGSSTDRGLLYLDGRWYSPSVVFAGPRVFGRWRPFVPSSSTLKPLWRILGIRIPNSQDCIAVLGEIATAPLASEDRATVLDTMRALAADLASISPQSQWRVSHLQKQLHQLPLWTGRAWVSKRPIYAIEDESLAVQVAEKIPVWMAGFSSLSDVEKLLDPLGVVVIGPDDFAPRSFDGRGIAEGENLRKRFSLAVEHLRDALIRGDRSLYDSLKLSWRDLCVAPVMINPDLELALTLKSRLQLTVAADAHMNRNPPVFIVRSEELAGRPDAGGRAIASLFDGDRQKVAWAWAVMWARAGEGEIPDPLILSEADTDINEPSDALVRLKAQIDKRSARSQRSAPPGDSGGTTIVNVRRLKDLSVLHPDNGTIINQGAKVSGILFPTRKPLVPPPGPEANIGSDDGKSYRHASRSESTVLPPASEREALARRAIKMALRADNKELVDLRARHGVGADAVDDLRQFYEIKMASSSEVPNEITMTASEVARAQAEPDFFLAVVSGLEELTGQLRVRFIFNPLRLTVKIRGDVTLSGVREAEALEFPFHTDDLAASDPDAPATKVGLTDSH
jgi:hypothetical protein